MERSFERKGKLPAFKCDLATLETYINEIVLEFGTPTPPVSISVDLPGQHLSFDSVNEMRTYTALPNSVTTLLLSIGDYRLSPAERSYMCLWQLWGDPTFVTAQAPSEAWCAGIVEKTKAFANSQRAWYWFIKPWMVYLINLAIGFTAGVMLAFLLFAAPVITSTTFITFGTLLIFLMTCAYIFISYDRVFPQFVLVIHQKESWFRNHATELTILAAGISALAAIYTAFKR